MLQSTLDVELKYLCHIYFMASWCWLECSNLDDIPRFKKFKEIEIQERKIYIYKMIWLNNNS